ncbi:hypothetical protein CQ018_02405 [Arthrobacter sp. MYb227]|uniref:winged helix DNA-binding domain-containing protein n=1 Tax=Arthrobacter sp. MYb227 TaxID=1848601 RepID=UPI000CFA8079|nr:winged helix DNA-binding domain-containing protein [Arthrobacter sp. MYb227]PQZ96153.1 hypothetical protein CQ018_02405 [Arthrobacter sp. MYb227]
MNLAPVHAKPQRTVLARMRLAAQGLVPGVPIATAPTAASTPADVVATMGMMQAQDLAQACWAIGVRLPGSHLETIHAALAHGSVIRCWGARGTLMLMSPQLHAALLSVTAPRMDAAMASIRARENITEAEIGKLAAVAADRCADSGATRAELLEAFEKAGSSVTGQRGYHLIVAVSLRGVIVQGPMEPGSTTRQLFMASTQWITQNDGDPDPEVSLRLLVETYIRSHGPATAADCAWWLGMPVLAVRAALEAQAHELPSRILGGETYYYAVEHSERFGANYRGGHPVLALPGFDELILGYKDRWPTLDAAHTQAVTPGKNGIFLRTIVIAGHVVGTWKVEGRGATLHGVSNLFEEPHSATRQLEISRAIERYLKFRGIHDSA